MPTSFPRLAPLLLAAALTPCAAPAAAPAANRPNFVFFLTDDQPYAGLGCTSDTGLRTPAMDQLAADGIFFENAFVTDWYYEHVYSDPARRPIPRVEGLRTERWKYTRYLDTSPLVEELFDLRTDPREEANLARASAHAGTLTQLRARCGEYRHALR